MTTRNSRKKELKLNRELSGVVSFHGHLCPGLLIGYRAAKAGMKRLRGRRSGDEELIAIVENNSCAVDAVQFLTGATFGKGNLFFRDYGKQVFTFAKRPGGKAVRVALRPDVFARPAPSREDRVKMLLTAKDDDLFNIKNVRITLPAEAEIHQSLICASCGEPVMDTRTRKVKGKVLCIPCAEKV
ncbi:MAG TPA: FmdE family protein [bacterium]|nr:FmdE family protein [bacterium]